MTAPDSRPLAEAMRYVGVGVQFIAEAAVLTALGWWADGKLETTPWLMVCGALLGLVLATTSLIRTIQRLEAQGRKNGDPGTGGGSR